MISRLLKQLGFEESRNKQSKSTSPLEDSIAKSVEAFRNRRIYQHLSIPDIDSIAYENLIQTVFDNLCEQLSPDFREEYETVLGWTDAQQAIYVIWVLEAEVNNGGFNQFYFNSSGQYAELLPKALNLIGAPKFADLVVRANRVYEREKEDITRRQDGTIEGFSKSYENNPLNALDNEFFKLYDEEDLQKLQVEFIRKNKSDFVN